MPDFNKTLREECEHLYETCQIGADRSSAVNEAVKQITDHQGRYAKVSAVTNVPWYVIGFIHSMESDCDFYTHLHNGDPLSARTVQVPAGRPLKGTPPFEWEDSAVDALEYDNLAGQTDWRLAKMLYRFEKFNGFGYRGDKVRINSPYLWSFSNHYEKGKFEADGKWNADLVSDQCGTAVMLKRMVEQGVIALPEPPVPTPIPDSLNVRYSLKAPDDEKLRTAAKELQRALSTYPDIMLTADGACGPKTSAAYKSVTGRYLPGDPEA